MACSHRGVVEGGVQAGVQWPQAGHTLVVALASKMASKLAGGIQMQHLSVGIIGPKAHQMPI
jgi:hypothetical protein